LKPDQNRSSYFRLPVPTERLILRHNLLIYITYFKRMMREAGASMPIGHLLTRRKDIGNVIFKAL
jgi:hypothetical protein